MLSGRKLSLFVVVLFLSTVALAETGADAWLRYAPLDRDGLTKTEGLPATAALLGKSDVLTTAQQELIRGFKGMTGRTLRAQAGLPTENAIVIATISELQ